MAEILDLADKIKRYYKFTQSELRGLIIAILTIAFVFSYDDWGPGNTFVFSAGIYNFFNAILIVALSVLIHDAGQRIWALAIGYRLEFRMWGFGLIITLIVAFLNNGRIPYLWIVVPGGFMLHHLAGHRLGWFRYGINYFGQAMVALAGPLSIFMLIILLRVLSLFSSNPLLGKAIIFNVIYMIINLLPIPPLDGSKIYFGSRMLYAFAVPAMIIAIILVVVNVPIFLSLIISLLIAVVLWLTYYISFERNAWFGPK
ncbi:hypothetical protein HYT53_05235 [Candidatus Woesearchaeota archaeon]|nr:hypothetical protein [Candidatus Woesearchaeota archaeon]